jgi:hypothetical protein
VSQPAAPDTTLATARAVQARNAVFVVFALAGVAFATFASRIADSKVQLGLTAGELGLTLFAASAGSLTALPSAGRIAGRRGPSTSGCCSGSSGSSSSPQPSTCSSRAG